MANYREFMAALTFLMHQWLQWNHLKTLVHFKLFTYELFIHLLSWESTVAAGTAGTQFAAVRNSLCQPLIWQIIPQSSRYFHLLVIPMGKLATKQNFSASPNAGVEYKTFTSPDLLKILQWVSGNQNLSEGYMIQVSVVTACLSDIYTPNLTGNSLYQSRYFHQKLWYFSFFIHSSLMRIHYIFN